MTGIGIFDS